MQREGLEAQLKACISFPLRHAGVQVAVFCPLSALPREVRAQGTIFSSGTYKGCDGSKNP